MVIEERHEKIVELLLEQKSATVGEMSEKFDVSSVTIRNDLNQLAEQGRVERTHGGARLGDGRTRQEFSFITRRRINAAEKQRIGEMAASFVQSSESVLLDASTTALAVGRALKERTDLFNVTVVTTGIWTALEMLGAPHLEVVLTGGNVRNETGSIAGVVATDVLNRFHFHKAILGAWGLTLDGGLMDAPLVEVELKQAVLPRCQELIAVLDGSKFGRTSLATIAPISGISRIVTDESAPEDLLKKIGEQGVEIFVAK